MTSSTSSGANEKDETDLGDADNFGLPSFGAVPRAAVAESDEEAADGVSDEADDYTLDSDVHQQPPQEQPIRLVNSASGTSARSDQSGLKTRIKKSFTFTGNSRRSTILRRPFSHRSGVTSPDVERDAGRSDRMEEQAIAEDLVKAHGAPDDAAETAADAVVPGAAGTRNSTDDATLPGNDAGKAYLMKEEFDDEINHVNDQFSEIPHNVQTGILSSLLKLYHDTPVMRADEYVGSGGGDADDEYGEYGDADEFDADEDSSIDDAAVEASLDLNPSKSQSEMDALRSRFNRRFKAENRSRSPLNIKVHARKASGALGVASRETRRSHGDHDMLDLPEFKKQRRRPRTKADRQHHKLGEKLKEIKQHNKMARARITVHIADILHRQKFILKLCKTFMLYGAPTHRLEEYLIATSRVLEIDASFIYFPGCMLISFGDATTRTSEMHLVRCAQGLDLGKLHDVHTIYKKVMHDMVSVDDAIEELDALLAARPIYNNYVLIFVNGLSSLFITTWGFKGGWRDMPISFVLGSFVGFLQIVVSPRSNTFTSVFEVSASILVAFLSRAFGSIPNSSGNDSIFCFSAIAQSSLVAILPGYTILCGSLELQSRNIVSGAVRMFYAIIYSLFLGFGIILGSALYKWVDKGATSETSCPANVQVSDYYRILFVPLFALTQAIIGQAKWRQIPIMMFISCASYVGYYYASLHFSSSAEFSAAIGAFLVGILGNLYSRVGQGLAVTAMYPGILLLVPGSIGLKSSLSSGITIADEIVKGAGSGTTSSSTDTSLSFGIAMIEVAIGLCVGLILAAVVVYPFGKTRTGLFTL